MAHPLRSPAGSSTWRAGRRSLTFCQSCQGSAQKSGLRLTERAAAEDKKGELAGACLELYRAEKDGLLRMDEEHLEAAWITGSDGVYTDLDYINDRICRDMVWEI